MKALVTVTACLCVLRLSPLGFGNKKRAHSSVSVVLRKGRWSQAFSGYPELPFSDLGRSTGYHIRTGVGLLTARQALVVYCCGAAQDVVIDVRWERRVIAY